MGSRHVPLAKKMHKYGYFFTFMPYYLRFPAGTNSNLSFLRKQYAKKTQNRKQKQKSQRGHLGEI